MKEGKKRLKKKISNIYNFTAKDVIGYLESEFKYIIFYEDYMKQTYQIVSETEKELIYTTSFTNAEWISVLRALDNGESMVVDFNILKGMVDLCYVDCEGWNKYIDDKEISKFKEDIKEMLRMLKKYLVEEQLLRKKIVFNDERFRELEL